MSWIEDQVRRIKAKELLPPDVLAAGDLDELLDRRDHEDFDKCWCDAHQRVEARWKDTLGLSSQESALKRLRKAVFLAASSASDRHEIAAYISDDFDLIAKAQLLGLHDDFIESLWATYAAGRLPGQNP